ncbi:MAG: patatin-like phospholipase family protein [Alloprevotella sp.]|nr:patatin-like phospholipase family protein [Alloprevotella sp.]
MKRIRISLLLLGMTLLTPSLAQRQRIGLALGGGGAKGAAEVGVLKVMEEEGIRPDFIAGTSIGSIVGGLYSLGFSADSLRNLFHNADWAELLSDGWFHSSDGYGWLTGGGTIPMPTDRFGNAQPRTGRDAERPFWQRGLVRGTLITQFFEHLTKRQKRKDFDRLPIPFRAVAVDMKTGQEVVLSRGALSAAMRASMSIPALFEPVEWGDWMLIDGGARNNFPADVVREMGADVVIGVDLSQTGRRAQPAAPEPSLGIFDIFYNSLVGILGQDKYRDNLRRTDVYINPDLGDFGPYDFTTSAVDEMYRMGYDAASELRPLLRSLKR